MAASGSVNFNISALEVIPAGDGSGAGSIEHALAKFAGLTTSRTFGGTGSPTWVDTWSDTVDLAAGTATIDLNALARQAPLEDVDAGTQKLVAWAFAGAAANTAGIEVAPDATNGYFVFGTTDDKITVYPNQIVMGVSMGQADLPAVAAGSADEITFTGTGTEQIHVLLIFGA